MSETQHWYDPISGKLVLEVPRADGKGMKAPTLREARILGLLPSVTNILSCLHKPMLANWQQEQAIKAAWEHKDMEDAKLAAQSYTRYAADFGTVIHGYVAEALEGKSLIADSPLGIQGIEVALKVKEFMDEAGFVTSHCEYPVLSRTLGYAGTADWLGTFNGEPTICDFKTREDNYDFYDEQAMQLSGYALGLGKPHLQRVSMLIDRQKPGTVKVKVWKKEEVEQRWDLAWKHLVSFWYAQKGLRRES